VALLDFTRDIIGSSPLPSSQPQCFGYLPLFSGKEYASGIAVYLSVNGTIGLEAHFLDTAQLLESRDSCPKYLPFGSGEPIAFTWLLRSPHRSKPNHSGKNLLVRAIYPAPTRHGQQVQVDSPRQPWMDYGISISKNPSLLRSL
jgi:hypothetical protein